MTHEKYTFAETAKAVGVSEQTIRQWLAKFAAKPAACGEQATLDELREEFKSAYAVNCVSPRQIEKPKRATAYFSQQSL